MNDMAKNQTVNLRDSGLSGVAFSGARCYRVSNSVSAGGGFEKARQAWAGCGCAARSTILLYAQARQTRRQPKIAAAFFEPNSITLSGNRHKAWVAGMARISGT